MTYTDQFLKEKQPLTFIRVASADTIRFPFDLGNNKYDIRTLLPSCFIIQPLGEGSYPGLIIPYLDREDREYLLYYVSETLTEAKFMETRKLVTLKEKSSFTGLPVGPDNKVGLKDLDMSPDGNYYYSGREFKGYGSEFLLLVESGGHTYFFPQYLQK